MKTLSKQISILFVIICLLASTASAVALEAVSSWGESEKLSVVKIFEGRKAAPSYSEDEAIVARNVVTDGYEVASREMSYSKAKATAHDLKQLVSVKEQTYINAGQISNKADATAGQAELLLATTLDEMKASYKTLSDSQQTIVGAFAGDFDEALEIAAIAGGGNALSRDMQISLDNLSAFDDQIVGLHNEIAISYNNIIAGRTLLQNRIGGEFTYAAQFMSNLIDDQSNEATAVNGRKVAMKVIATITTDENLKKLAALDESDYNRILSLASGFDNSTKANGEYVMNHHEFAARMNQIRDAVIDFDTALGSKATVVSEAFAMLNDWHQSYTELVGEKNALAGKIDDMVKNIADNKNFILHLGAIEALIEVKNALLEHLGINTEGISLEAFFEKYDRLLSYSSAISTEANNYQQEMQLNYITAANELREAEALLDEAIAIRNEKEEELSDAKSSLKKQVTTYQKQFGEINSFEELMEAVPITNDAATKKEGIFLTILSSLMLIIQTPAQKLAFGLILLMAIIGTSYLLKRKGLKKESAEQVDTQRQRQEDYITTNK